MTYTLYIGNKRYSSWSMRPWVLLKALDIPFIESFHAFQPGIPQPAFKAFSPSSKVPCLHDSGNSDDGGDGSDDVVVVWDSLAICEYIAEAHPTAWPASRPARAFARAAAAEMHSGFAAVRDELSMNVGLRIQLDGAPGPALRKDLARLEALWTDGLKRFGGPWLAGDRFSIADVFFAPVATRVQTYGIELGEDAAGYVRRLLEHPAVDAWVQDGIRESEREPMHEEDCVRGRTILQDLSKS